MTPSGVNMTPITTNLGPIYTGTLGQLKGSPNSAKIAAVNYGVSNFNIIDFNNSTGSLNNPTTINMPTGQGYGIEFSPLRTTP